MSIRPLSCSVIVTLSVVHQNGCQETLSFSQEVIRIGSSPKSHLCLQDKLASRMHAVMEIGSNNQVGLVDLGNQPGTAVNGKLITQQVLKQGDVVEIGGTKIVVETIQTISKEQSENIVMNASKTPSNVVSATATTTSTNPFADANPFGKKPAVFSTNNPFVVAEEDIFAVPENAPEGSYTYAFVKAGELSSEEVEDKSIAAVEVVIQWGESVLHIAHLSPIRSFYVGEEESNHAQCDFFLPSEKLGTARTPLVVVEQGTTYAVFPAGSKGTVTFAGQSACTLEELRASGKATLMVEVPGACKVALAAGTQMSVTMGDFTFRVSSVAAGKRVKKGLFMAASATVLGFVGLSMLAHLGILAGFAFTRPAMGDLDDESNRQERTVLMQQYLKTAAEQEKEVIEEKKEDSGSNGGKDGGQAKGPEGVAGSQLSKNTGKRAGFKGPKNNPTPTLSKQELRNEAASFGIIGMLNSGVVGNPNTLTAPWATNSEGSDPISAKGNLWGSEIGDSQGTGGLGLSGIGEFGGGIGDNIGVGNIQTIGNGKGCKPGVKCTDGGFGRSHGRLTQDRQAKSPVVHMVTPSVGGTLPSSTIQRIVRQSYGSFRMCYMKGLVSNPSLAGRVSVAFVISRSGAVSNAQNAGSDLSDSSVTSCVVNAFRGLSFPAPEDGIVTVTYPISFSPAQ
jgi:pSer/pThr/pTyr-binding forkhead associated (FHA) protein